jgi:dTDP-4-dehydrorhamnose 3,5-epimerase-like enzyme
MHSGKIKVQRNGDMNGLFKEKLAQEHSIARMRITTPTINHSCSSCAVHLVAYWPHGQSERLADGPHQ